MNSLKYYCYIFFATIFGAYFMWFAFLCIQLSLSMISQNATDSHLSDNFAKYAGWGAALLGAIIGYLNGQNWWVELYEKDSSLKWRHRGFSGIKLRLRQFMKSVKEDSNYFKNFLP